MQRLITGAVAALIVALGLSTHAVADAQPEDAIKFRHAVMQTMAGNINAFMLIAFDKVDGGDYLQTHADALATSSAELDILFPAGSGDGETHALPSIWEDTDQFAEAIARIQETALDLKAAVAGGDRKAIKGAFASLGKACKGCHENFRAEDDDSDSHSH